MKITNKSAAIILFEDIDPGDVFECDGNIYMKTETTADSLNNAVDLFDGEVKQFTDQVPVYQVTCELVIE